MVVCWYVLHLFQTTPLRLAICVKDNANHKIVVVMYSLVRRYGCHLLWRSCWLGHWFSGLGFRCLLAASDNMDYPHRHRSGHHQHPARSKRSYRVHHWLHGAWPAPCHDDVQELWLCFHGSGLVLCSRSEARSLHESAPSCHVHLAARRLCVVCNRAGCRHELGPWPYPQRLRRGPREQLHMPRWPCLLHRFNHLGRHWPCSNL